jgi:hypothetical protein
LLLIIDLSVERKKISEETSMNDPSEE